MQLPYRKPGKFSQTPLDPYITERKFEELNRKLNQLVAKRPHAAQEVSRLAELGDFSENVEYQLAKGKLRRINEQILIIENQIKHAEVIRPDHTSDTIDLGDTVVVNVNGVEKTFTILGSSETEPGKGVISRNSPMGNALIGREVGDQITVTVGKKKVVYTIVSKKRS